MGPGVAVSLADDAQHWRARAAEARAMAEQLTDEKAKKAMLNIAKSYERIAKRAEQRQTRRSRRLSRQPLIYNSSRIATRRCRSVPLILCSLATRRSAAWASGA